MAQHRTAAVLATAAAALIVSAGCDNLSFRQLDYDNTEAARISSIRMLSGAGDVTVRANGAQDEVRIKRTVRYQGGQPDAKYEIKGTELVLDTDCGSRCTVSYEVTAPAGVSVQGLSGSGDVDLSKVGRVEMRLGSGNIRFLCADRSAIAPMTGSTKTVSSTDSDTRYGKYEPAATLMPSGYTYPVQLSAPSSQPAASSVTVVRNGPRNTVMTVVEKADIAQS